MIRINLLLVKRKKKPKPIPAVYIQSAIALVITLLVLGVITFYLSGKVSGLKSDKAVKEKRLTELKVQLKEVENFERDKKAFEEKIKIIEQLENNQKAPLRLLDQVSAQLPKGVWLTSLIDKGGAIDISGYAFTNTELVTYIQNLKGSKYLTDVALLESKQEKAGELLIYKFKLTLRVKA
ncbi:MAG: PilN domain-containing protein [Thermodesulfovibrionia bacterium]